MEAVIWIISIVFAILNIILFFKIWGMTSDISDMKNILIKIANKDSNNNINVSQPKEEPSSRNKSVVQPSSKETIQNSNTDKPFVEKKTNIFSNTKWGILLGSLTKTELKYHFDADGKHYTFSTINYKSHVSEEGTYSVNGGTISLKPSNGNQQRTLTYSSAADALIPSDSPNELYKRWN